jgi:hypothetical protein
MGSAPVQSVADRRESRAAICWLYSFKGFFAVPR